MNQSVLSHSRLPVVSILTDTYSEFHRQLLDPVAVLLKNKGYGVIVVAGSQLKSDIDSGEPTYNDANRIFSVTKSYDIAGCLILTGCIGHNLSSSEIDVFVKGFVHLPVVSLGVDVPSASSIVANNRAGMRRLMNHVTADPKRQNFVFIRGFKEDENSIVREQVFREVLNEKGIPIKEHFILTGNFVALDAYTEMDRLLSHHADIDVVVAANDEMAASAIRALKEHNFKLPAQVLVAGYDDSPKARDCSPTLTSVVQPLKAQVEAAVETLVSLMNNSHHQLEKYPTQSFDCSLVVRASTVVCKPVVYESDYSKARNLETAVDQFVTEFIADNISSIQQPDGRSYEVLFHLLRLKLRTKADLYEHIISSLLEHDTETNERDLSWWREFEVIFSRFVLGMSRSPCFSSLIPSLVETQVQLRELTWSLKNEIQLKYEYGTLMQTRLHNLLAKCEELSEIKKILGMYFDRFAVKSAFLVLYHTIGTSVDCLARVSYIYSTEKSVAGRDVEWSFQEFESKDILPLPLLPELSCGTLVLHPLFDEDVQFGYVLIDPSGVGTLNFENLAYSLSNAIRHCHELSPSMPQDDIAVYTPHIS